MTPPGQAQYQNTPVNVKVVLSWLWVAMLFVFAYVDMFGFFRADVLHGALEGEVGSRGLAVDQVSLTATLIHGPLGSCCEPAASIGVRFIGVE